jgi:ribosomal protein S18 acetylase RimI-like enzyme
MTIESPEFSQGVSTALMLEMIRFGKDSRCSKVWLGTELDNQSARGLYESLQPENLESFVGFTFEYK